MERQKEEKDLITKLIREISMKNYGIREYNRDKWIVIIETLKCLIDSKYSYDQIKEGLRLACESSPKFFPRLQEILVSTRTAIKYIGATDESENYDQDFEEGKKQTARRDKQRAWVEGNFKPDEISKAIDLWCAKTKNPRNWGTDLLFFSEIANKGSYARNLLVEMMEQRDEDTKCKGKGKEVTTMGKGQTDREA